MMKHEQAVAVLAPLVPVSAAQLLSACVLTYRLQPVRQAPQHSTHVGGFVVQHLLDNKYSQYAVLASNFGGTTGGLLSLDGGELAGRLKADALFPVAGYKRCLDTQNGYGEKVDSSSETA